MKTALIVDDSRLARTVLRNTLAENGIAVDEAPSAEAAIEYLQFDRPDVIFLDHTMPGMDGFEALDAIKTNPTTATIPVMMYTSQGGQFYVSQARALGAVDVLPKSLKPADVKRVLRLHHLIDEAGTNASVGHTPPGLNKQEVTELVRGLFHELTETLLAGIQVELTRAGPERSEIPPPVLIQSTPTAPSSLAGRVVTITSLTTLAAVVAFGFLYSRATSVLGDPNGQVPGQVPALAAASEAEVDVQETRPATEQPSSGETERLDVPAWTQYQTVRYPFEAVPLDDARAFEYGSLLAQLRDEGFSGSVVIDVHEGRYCMNYTAQGAFELAPPDQLAVACDQIGTSTATGYRAQQSDVFANMVAVATRDGQLTVETVSHGDSLPIIDYPVLDYSVTAGYWNSIAAFNQRISLRVQQKDSSHRSTRISRLEAHSNLAGQIAPFPR